jgi:hypothetical protein
VTPVGEDSMLRFCYCLALFSSGINPGPDLSPTRKSARHEPATGFMHPSGTCIQACFGAKEIQDRRTVLFERAVLIGVHRINAATSKCSAGTKTNCPEDGVEQETANEAKKKQSERETFFFEMFCRFLAH